VQYQPYNTKEGWEPAYYVCE